MFERIVLATDLSPASKALVGCVIALKGLGVKKVFLTYALGIRYLDDLRHLIASSVEPALLEQKKRFEEHGLEAAVELAPGVPSEEINRVADEKDASLIVIGSHGETMARHVLSKFGGTTSEVLHSFTRPLLLVRTRVLNKGTNGCVEESCADFLRHVLFCTDFSDTAQRAFSYVEKLVESGCRTVTIMHVQDRTRIEKHLSHKLDEFNRIDAERIEMLRERLTRKMAVRVDMKIPYGIPTSEILKEIAQGGYSLVVMGSQGRGYVREIFLGSVSHNVARNAPISALFIPAVR